MTTINLQVGADADDGHTAAGILFKPADDRMDAGDWSGTTYHIFARWTAATLEGTIDSSVVQVYGKWTAGSPVLKVYGVDEDNPPAPTSIGEFDADPLTSAAVDWDAAWTVDAWATSPSLNTIFQELVDTYTISNDAVMVQIKDDGSTSDFNGAATHDFDTALAAKLDIDYTAGAGVTVTPGVIALVLTEFAPTISTPRLVTPPTLALILSEFAPTVSTPRLVTPPTLALTLTEFAPTILLPVTATPTTLALILTEFVPLVSVGAAIEVTPDTLALILATFAPTAIPSTYESHGAPFLYTAAKWGGSLTFYLEVYIKAVTGTARARLWNDTDGSVVTGSGLSTAQTSYTRLRTSALTLIDGKSYLVQFGTEDGTAGEFGNGRLIVL